ncbi:MAG TPA: UvrD-helicase domain-containing protein [Pseudonocardiaceae bacterium]|nr:UvrD-helicase domain-containing protein [Pseudonocardiaceae bacterium]
MPQLAIAKEFLPSYAKLETRVQRAVDDALSKFAEHTHAGLHLEKLHNSKDPRIRTIRITDFYRGVVLAPESGDQYYLITVLGHDEAKAYATSRRFTVNQVLGVLEVRNQDALDDLTPALRQAADRTEKRLLDHVKDKDLARLGIEDSMITIARLLTSAAHLDAMAALLPDRQYNVLFGLATGMNADEVWQEMSQDLIGGEAPEHVDPTDLAKAVERTPDRYAMVSGPAELTTVLADPFAAWRVFLHPRQHAVAYRLSYRGPAMVSGGAGTGKTVTALHRAAFLAQRDPEPANGAPILLTTFSRGLAESLEAQLAQLVPDPAVRSRIEVRNVDRVAYRVVSEARGIRPDIIRTAALGALWKRAAATTGGELSAAFLEREWEQVILAQNLRHRDAYLGCRRRGAGQVLLRPARERAWTAISGVLAELRASSQRTHLQVADEAADILARPGAGRYRHVIVDEGQDLHPAQWRLLRAAVAPGADDLFIVADPNQRVYDNRVSLQQLDIRVRGRSHRLTISYRTTQEILSWTVRILDDEPPDGLDELPDQLAGYRSETHGRRPVVRAYPDAAAELDGLVAQVREWLDSGVEAFAIGVAARTNRLATDARAALSRAGLSAAGATAKAGDAIRVDTMHAMKGREFRCVAVIAVDADIVPQAAALTDVTEDPVTRRQDMQRERCLLFVACTRARDVLHVSHVAGQPSPFLPR